MTILGGQHDNGDAGRRKDTTRVSVFGLGYVGAVTAGCLAEPAMRSSVRTCNRKRSMRLMRELPPSRARVSVTYSRAPGERGGYARP